MRAFNTFDRQNNFNCVLDNLTSTTHSTLILHTMPTLFFITFDRMQIGTTEISLRSMICSPRFQNTCSQYDINLHTMDPPAQFYPASDRLIFECREGWTRPLAHDCPRLVVLLEDSRLGHGTLAHSHRLQMEQHPKWHGAEMVDNMRKWDGLGSEKGISTSHLRYLQHPCYFRFSLKKSGFSHNYFWFV